MKNVSFYRKAVISIFTNEYFIGSMSPSGYKTNFSECIDEPGYFTYILKGEASCSGFIRRITEKLNNKNPELYYCAVDPESIDAAVFPDSKVIICDSISPHLFEPKIAGITGQIVNLSESWDTEKLKAAREELSMLHSALTSGSERAERCIKALSTVLYDNFDLAKRTVLLEKLDAFFGRLTKKVLPKRSANHPDDVTRGKVIYRYSSALTADGIKTLLPKGGTVYILADDYSAGANHLLSRLVAEASSRGFDVIVSKNPLLENDYFDVYSHIAIPELNLYFYSSTYLAPLDTNNRAVNFMRFYSKGLLAAKRQRMRFNNEAAESLLSEAVTALCSVREIKRKTEQYYEKVIDENVIKEVEEKILKKLQ
ncbi:MAG: hypothetical protein LBL80_03390 [Ruminococcus sp.]|jgi:hypothetical protein|nr:hypothetical protein [Ruminococcus sp.]